MANTYTRLLFHCVWSTKDRAPLIQEEIEAKIWAYLAGIAQQNKMHALRIGGIENHVHLLIEIPKTLTVSDAIKQLKGGSSPWINTEEPTKTHFAWQDGYSAFTVSHPRFPTSSNTSRISASITVTSASEKSIAPSLKSTASNLTRRMRLVEVSRPS